MATKEDMKRIAAKAADDAQFAQSLEKDPVDVLEKEGIFLTEAEKKKILEPAAQGENVEVRQAAYVIVV